MYPSRFLEIVDREEIDVLMNASNYVVQHSYNFEAIEHLERATAAVRNFTSLSEQEALGSLTAASRSPRNVPQKLRNSETGILLQSPDLETRNSRHLIRGIVNSEFSPLRQYPAAQ